MSENNSQPSPISASRLHESEEQVGTNEDQDDLTADLDLGFDGAEDILRTWRRGVRPDPDLTVSDGPTSIVGCRRAPAPSRGVICWPS